MPSPSRLIPRQGSVKKTRRRERYRKMNDEPAGGKKPVNGSISFPAKPFRESPPENRSAPGAGGAKNAIP